MTLNVEFTASDMQMDADLGTYQMVYNGENGATYTPQISEDGILSWTNDRGNENPEPVSVIGPPGPIGVTGNTGQRGSKILKVVSGPGRNEYEVNGSVPPFNFFESRVLQESGADEVLAGDVIWLNDQHFPVVHVGVPEGGYSSLVFAGESVSFIGPRGYAGQDGVSVTSIAQTTTSNEDGGSNIITAKTSDGFSSKFTIKNGRKGGKGDKGDKGDTGQRGTGVLMLTTALEYHNQEVDGFAAKYRKALSAILSESGVGEVLIGDTLTTGNTYYTVGYIDDTYAYTGGAYQFFMPPKDGVSPTVAVTDIEGGHRVTITDEDGTKTFDVMDGERGTGLLKVSSIPESYRTEIGGFTPVGRMELATIYEEAKVDEVLVGDAIMYGYYYQLVGYVDDTYAYLGSMTYIARQGKDGVSPTVAVSEIAGGHRVAITDANGTQTFDVMDGAGSGSAAEWLVGSTTDITPIQVANAIYPGNQNVLIWHTDEAFGTMMFTNFVIASQLGLIMSSVVFAQEGVAVVIQLMGDGNTNTWSSSIMQMATYDDLPTALPNPNTLTFTGAATGTYDGSSAVTVEIPAGGGGAFVVNATTSEDGSSVTIDKTWMEILLAHRAGQTVQMLMDDAVLLNMVVPPTSDIEPPVAGNGYGANFTAVQLGGGIAGVLSITVHASSEAEIEFGQLQLATT